MERASGLVPVRGAVAVLMDRPEGANLPWELRRSPSGVRAA